MIIQISKIKFGKRFRKDIGDIDSLAKSMQDVGLLHPIVLDEKNDSLIAGNRRIAAAVQLGWAEIDCTKISIDDSRIAQIQENTERKDFTASEIGDIAEYVESQKKVGRPRKGSDSAPLKGKTDDIVAEITHVSHDTVSKIKKIRQAARDNPKEYGALLEKIDHNIGTVNRAYIKLQIDENKKLPKQKIPKGKYNLIIWDPSWPHDIEVAGGSGTSGNAQKYRPESIEEMCQKGLQGHLAEDAILGIWTLPTFHSEVLDVIQANGFEKIKTKIYWDKMVPTMGFNFRNSVEELCICVRGTVKAFWQTDQPNIIHVKKGGPHSRKPEIVFEIMEKAAKAGLPTHKLSKLEINATKPRPGWVTVGNQIMKTTTKTTCKADLQTKCKCNHTKIIHNTDHTTGEDYGGSCAYQSTCGCKNFVAKKSRKVIPA